MKVPEDFCTVAFLFLKQHELTYKDVYRYFTTDIYSIYIYCIYQLIYVFIIYIYNIFWHDKDILDHRNIIGIFDTK